jgi:hypothetical protein
MNFLRSACIGVYGWRLCSWWAFAVSAAQTPTQSAPASKPVKKTGAPSQILPAGSGRERELALPARLLLLSWPRRGGGESGPDLTRSKLVAEDVDGDKIGDVVRNGRPDKGMPQL